MAVATYTSSIVKAGNVPKAVHAGDQSVSARIVYSGTIGDILFLAKVPHGATIVDFWEYHTSGQTACGIDFGLSKGVASGGAGNQSCFVSAGAIATMNRMNIGQWNGPQFPPVVSLSDLDPIRFAYLIGSPVSGTTTISLSISYQIIYRMDGPRERGSDNG